MQTNIKQGLKKNLYENTHLHLVEVYLSILCHCTILPEVAWLFFHICTSSGHAFWIPSYENDWDEPLRMHQTNKYALLPAKMERTSKL